MSETTEHNTATINDSPVFMTPDQSDALTDILVAALEVALRFFEDTGIPTVH